MSAPTSRAPTPAAPRPYRFPHVDRHTTADGARSVVATLPARELATVTALFLRAGAAHDPPGAEGIADLTANALREGTAALDGAALAERFESLGTSLVAAADWDATTLSVSVAPRHLDAAVETMCDVLRAPAFRARDIERLQSEHRAARLQVTADPRALGDSAFAWTCYNAASRFRRPEEGTRATVAALTRADLERFARSHYTRDSLAVVVAGNVDTDRAHAITARVAAAVPATGPAPAAPVVAARARVAEILLVEKPGAAQAELRLGHVGVARSHPEYFALTLMNAILGGLFSSRINLNLRERHGYTYGAFSGFDWRVHAGPWSVSTAVQTEVCVPAVREVLAEIERMRTLEVSVDELELARSYLVGVFPLRFETTASVAAALASQAVFALPHDYFDEYRAHVSAVTSADVLRVARAHLDPGALQLVVVGDPAALRGELEQLGVGPVRTASPDDVEAAR